MWFKSIFLGLFCDMLRYFDIIKIVTLRITFNRLESAIITTCVENDKEKEGKEKNNEF